MTLHDINDAIFARIRDSAPILAKAQALFSVPHAVYSGADGPQSPELGPNPEFMILPFTKETPEAGDQHFEFALGVALQQPLVTTATTASGVYTEVYPGRKNVEELMDLAWAEVLQVSANLSWAKGNFEINPIALFPDFSARMTITATVYYTIGAGVVSL